MPYGDPKSREFSVGMSISKRSGALSSDLRRDVKRSLFCIDFKRLGG